MKPAENSTTEIAVVVDLETVRAEVRARRATKLQVVRTRNASTANDQHMDEVA